MEAGMKEKFTKGVWTAKTRDYAGVKAAIIYMPGGGFDISGCPDCISNAHLIASAPEMYDHLNGIHESICLNGGVIELDEDDCEYIGRLLAKARGEK